MKTTLDSPFNLHYPTNINTTKGNEMYKIARKIKGTRTFFFVTLNDVRISKTNFARKYDAVSQIRLHKEWKLNKVAV